MPGPFHSAILQNGIFARPDTATRMRIISEVVQFPYGNCSFSTLKRWRPELMLAVQRRLDWIDLKEMQHHAAKINV